MLQKESRELKEFLPFSKPHQNNCTIGKVIKTDYPAHQMLYKWALKDINPGRLSHISIIIRKKKTTSKSIWSGCPCGEEPEAMKHQRFTDCRGFGGT